MSDSVICDVCESLGKRPRGKTCPDNWMYADVIDQENGEIVVALTCSDDCRNSFWKPQDNLDLKSYILDRT